MPYRLTVRVVTDLLVLGFVLGLGWLAMALAQTVAAPPVPPPEFPWAAVIQGTITVLTAVLAWLVKNQVTQLHTTINSKMDALLKLTAAAAKAEGVLEEKTRRMDSAASEATGAAGEKARSDAVASGVEAGRMKAAEIVATAEERVTKTPPIKP